VGVAGAQAASPADHIATPEVAVHHHHWYEFGVASWYGKFFQGKTTASGVPFDENQLTCAHRTLPLGSVLRVTNLRNHRSVVVTVNDRGPVPEDRIIDLSHAAADALGFSERGLAPVKVELLGSSSQVAQLQAPADLPSAR
jgi:rare lipoprotein A